MITEQDRKELQTQFEEETGVKVINSQGEFDIDYVAWLEEKVIKNLNISETKGYTKGTFSKPTPFSTNPEDTNPYDLSQHGGYRRRK